MNFMPFAVPIALVVSLTALLLLITRDWRASVGLLAVQYVGVFFLVAIHWPLAMAVTKLIAGWMASAVLGMAALSIPGTQPNAAGIILSSNREGHSQSIASDRGLNKLFFILAASLVGMAVLSQLSRVTTLIPGIEVGQALGGLILIGLGLLKLGFADQLLDSILGLLTTFAGFEILYAVIEATPSTAGLIAGVTLGLAFTGAYLLVAPYMREEENIELGVEE